MEDDATRAAREWLLSIGSDGVCGNLAEAFRAYGDARAAKAAEKTRAGIVAWLRGPSGDDSDIADAIEAHADELNVGELIVGVDAPIMTDADLGNPHLYPGIVGAATILSYESGHCRRCGTTNPAHRNGRCRNVPASEHDWVEARRADEHADERDEAGRRALEEK